MKILEGLDGLKQVSPGAVLSVGNFDGMHLGHRRLLELAKRLRAETGGNIAVVTFEPHPLTVLRPELAPPRLTAAGVKHALLEEAGVDEYVVLPPSGEVFEFARRKNFGRFCGIRFGRRRCDRGVEFQFCAAKGRGGNIYRLREWAAAEPRIKLHVIDSVTVPLLDLSVVPVSSSLIRWLLGAWAGAGRGDLFGTGVGFARRGEVVEGFGLAGTAAWGADGEFAVCEDQLVPGDGVCVGRCGRWGHRIYRGNPSPMSLNETKHGRVARATYARATRRAKHWDLASTFGDQEPSRQVEAHLIGFDGDLYGRTIEVEVVDWIRAQRKFAGIERSKRRLRWIWRGWVKGLKLILSARLRESDERRVNHEVTKSTKRVSAALRTLIERKVFK